MYTVRRIISEHCAEFPEELHCMIYNHLIDMQVESARTLASVNGRPYLRDINVIIWNPWLGLISIIRNAKLTPTNVVQYHCKLYCNDSKYREEFLAKMPGEKLSKHLESYSEWVGFARLVRLSMNAWTQMLDHPFASEVKRRYLLERSTMTAK